MEPLIKKTYQVARADYSSAGRGSADIKRQLKQVEEFSRMEERPLPADLDYDQVTGLRLEAREKLKKIRPASFGQASRISGVSPADISVLMIYMETRT